MFDGTRSSKQLKTARGRFSLTFKLVYYDAPMVIRPFSFVIGMLPIGGFKNRVLFFGPTLAQKKKWSLLIDYPFKDGFWAKISRFLTPKRNEG